MIRRVCMSMKRISLMVREDQYETVTGQGLNL
ncbi:MAG: hypothetical protein ACI9QD_001160, partial [Thermoproteota archaeon]